MDPLHVALVAFPLLGLAIGALIGRRTSDAEQRARTLATELDAQRGATERAFGEKRAVEEELVRARADADAYRRRVVDHFYGTSDQLRSLTLRYRELFEHLAEGARELCPEASSALEAGLQAPALGSGLARGTAEIGGAAPSGDGADEIDAPAAPADDAARAEHERTL